MYNWLNDEVVAATLNKESDKKVVAAPTSGAPVEQSEEEAPAVLVEGAQLLKYGKSGPPKYKEVKYANGQLQWSDVIFDKEKQKGAKVKTSGLKLDDITMLLKGKVSQIFKKKAANSAEESMCFSIVTKKRTLDLQASSSAQRDIWVSAIATAVGRYRMAKLRAIKANQAVRAREVTKQLEKEKEKEKEKDKDAQPVSPRGKPQPSQSQEALASPRSKSGNSQTRHMARSMSGNSTTSQGSERSIDSEEELRDVSISEGSTEDPGETEEASLLRFLSEGGLLLKHGRSGAPKVRYVVHHKGKLYWAPSKKSNVDKLDTWLLLANVRGVLLGKNTSVFSRKSAKDSVTNHCFSVVTEERTLDLEATNKEDRDKWVKALRFVVKNAHRKAQLVRRMLTGDKFDERNRSGTLHVSPDSILVRGGVNAALYEEPNSASSVSSSQANGAPVPAPAASPPAANGQQQPAASSASSSASPPAAAPSQPGVKPLSPARSSGGSLRYNAHTVSRSSSASKRATGSSSGSAAAPSASAAAAPASGESQAEADRRASASSAESAQMSAEIARLQASLQEMMEAKKREEENRVKAEAAAKKLAEELEDAKRRMSAEAQASAQRQSEEASKQVKAALLAERKREEELRKQQWVLEEKQRKMKEKESEEQQKAAQKKRLQKDEERRKRKEEREHEKAEKERLREMEMQRQRSFDEEMLDDELESLGATDDLVDPALFSDPIPPPPPSAGGGLPPPPSFDDFARQNRINIHEDLRLAEQLAEQKQRSREDSDAPPPPPPFNPDEDGHSHDEHDDLVMPLSDRAGNQTPVRGMGNGGGGDEDKERKVRFNEEVEEQQILLLVDEAELDGADMPHENDTQESEMSVQEDEEEEEEEDAEPDSVHEQQQDEEEPEEAGSDVDEPEDPETRALTSQEAQRFLDDFTKTRGVLCNIKVDWIKRSAALVKLTEMSKGVNIPSIPGIWKEMDILFRYLADQLEDLRSNIIKDCTTLLVTLSEVCGEHEEFCDLFRTLLAVLFKRLFVTIKVISEAADQCIRSVLSHCYSYAFKCLPELMRVARDPHNIVRQKCCEYLAQLLNECPETQLKNLARHESRFKLIINKNITDPDKLVRAATRQLFLAFANIWPQAAHKLYDTFSPSTQKILTSELRAQVEY